MTGRKLTIEEAVRRSQENKRRFNAMAQGKTPQEKLFIYRKMIDRNKQDIQRKRRSIGYCCCFLFSALWSLMCIAILIGGMG